jgi:hypothetical protein
MSERPKSQYVDEIIDAVKGMDAPEPVVDIGYHVLDGRGRCQLCGYRYPVKPAPKKGARVKGRCLVPLATYWEIKRHPKRFFS